MRRFLLWVAEWQAAGGSSTAADDSSPITGGRILATVVTIAGAVGVARIGSWLWKDVVRPLVDSFIVRALKRERVNVEQFLRDEIFDDDIAAAEIRETMTQEAIRLSQQCASSLGKIEAAQQEQGKAVGEIPRVADAVDKLGGTLERLDSTLGDMRVEMGRQAGTLEQMQRSNWDGETERRREARRQDDNPPG